MANIEKSIAECCKQLKLSTNFAGQAYLQKGDTEYYVAAEPPVRCGESHHSGQTEPPYY